MEKEFVSYETALQLQDLGFKDDTICGYDSKKQLRGKLTHSMDGKTTISWDLYDSHLRAPLIQQALRWLRGRYGIRYVNDWTYYDGYHYFYRFSFFNGNYYAPDEHYNSPEESELALLQHMILKLKERHGNE